MTKIKNFGYNLCIPLKHNKYTDFANEVKQSFMAFRKAYNSTSSIEYLIYKSCTVFYIDNNFTILSEFFFAH